MAEDIVCNRQLDEADMTWASTYHGTVYTFCSLQCREQFELEPEDYLPIEERQPVAAAVMLRLVS
jgi:YHS domain-containing protein